MIALKVPGSKSITNRALLLAALAYGKSTLRGALESDDTRHMRLALNRLGVRIKQKNGMLEVRGGILKKPGAQLTSGNAGTVLRFLAAALATQPFTSALSGDARMKERPIDDLIKTLNQLGAHAVALRHNGKPPIEVKGPMLGGSCTISGSVSSQFLSGLLMASPLAEKTVTIRVRGQLVSKSYVDLTIALMKKFGVTVHRSGYKKFTVRAPQRYRPQNVKIEGDASSASYFWGLGTLIGEEVRVTNVPENSLQADVEFKNIVKSPSHLNCRDFPDSAMTLAVLCALRKGKTTLDGLGNLRVKECDRLHALATELRKIGCKTKEINDGLVIEGNPEKIHGAHIKTYNDHRMAMCFGMLGAVVPGIKIENPGCVSKTYPNFWRDLAAVKERLCKKNIIITGMRGSGKTKLGKLLGRQLGRRFIDLDDLIERRAKKPIGEIVAASGWNYFRALERKAVKSIAGLEYAVISTGGGTLMFAPNVRILKKTGKVIYLKSSIASIRRRLTGKKDRPALGVAENFLGELEEVYRRRKKQYERTADAVVDVSKQTSAKSKDFDEKLKKLIALVTRWGMI